MRTWRRGRDVLHEQIQKQGMPLDVFLSSLMLAPPVRVEGTAVFLTGDDSVAPQALLHNLKHNKVLHARNVFLTVAILEVPYVPRTQRLDITVIGPDFYRIVLRFGFMQTPDVPRALPLAEDVHSGLTFDPMQTTYFVSRETIIASPQLGMPVWRDKLFAFMHRNAAPANQVFRLPGNRLVELGAPVEI